MNLLRKLTELSPMRFFDRHVRMNISKKDLADFGLLLMICCMIIIYKINKATW